MIVVQFDQITDAQGGHDSHGRGLPTWFHWWVLGWTQENLPFIRWPQSSIPLKILDSLRTEASSQLKWNSKMLKWSLPFKKTKIPRVQKAKNRFLESWYHNSSNQMQNSYAQGIASRHWHQKSPTPTILTINTFEQVVQDLPQFSIIQGFQLKSKWHFLVPKMHYEVIEVKNSFETLYFSRRSQKYSFAKQEKEVRTSK